MKRHAIILIVCFGLMFGGAAALITFFSVPIMNEEEQTRLKIDKTFWKWHSPYGSLTMHYAEHGSGSNHVLFIHGFRAHSYTWKLLTDPLVQAGHHVWVLDLIGFGLSDKPNFVVYNQNFFIEQIKAFMQEHRISAAHIVGNSMGGTLALELALDQPDIVRSLTLINGLGYTLEMPYYLYVTRYLDFIWGPFLNPFIIRNCLYQVIHNKESITDEKVEAYCLPYRFPGGILASLLTMRQFDLKKLDELHSHFSQLHPPIMIIWGENDSLIPIDHYHQFLRDLPKAKILLISNCGHMPQEEKPEEVLSGMLPFFKEVEETN